MKFTEAMIWSMLVLPQSDPLESARQDMGSGFTVEPLEPGILMASPAGEKQSEPLRDSLRSAIRSFRARALDVPSQNSLLVVLFGSAKEYQAYTAQRYPGPIPQTSFYDVPNRRVLLRTTAAAGYARQAVRLFLLADSLNSGTLPPWLSSALPFFEGPETTPATFDHRAALLQEALRRGAIPPLRSLFAMDLGTYHAGSVLLLHTSISIKFFEYLEGRGRLRKFFLEYRKTFRSDVTGAAAVEAALGEKLEDIEAAFQTYLRKLPWLNSGRFLAQAKEVFGSAPLVLVDEPLLLAVTGNVDRRTAAEALDQLRRLRDPLVRLFDLKTSGLPVLARLFKDQEAFQEYAKVDAPHRQWLGGYFSFDSRWMVLHLEPDSGSLTHEYCHALFEDDVGRLPPWLSEGLACLYQHFKIEGGQPLGEPGADLAQVRTAVLQERAAGLPEFLSLKGAEFFEPGRVNLNYAFAHALLYFLQERRALGPMYRELQRVRRMDPYAPPFATSRTALEKAFGAKADQIGEEFSAWARSWKD